MAIKTLITRKTDDVVTNILDTCQVIPNGLQVTDSTMGSYIIGCVDQVNVYSNVDIGTTAVVPEKYKYTTSGGLVTNPNYVAPIDTNQQIKDLQNGLLQAQAAINTLLGV
jgi:hypothetical protein